MKEIVRVKSAPGLKWKKRRGDMFEARWQCRDELVKRPDFEAKFKIKSVKLWSGTADPTLDEWSFIADTCRQLQQEMLVWANGGLPCAMPFDGTIAGLIHSYRNDPDSVYLREGALRYASRIHYDAVMSLIEREFGTERVAEVKGRVLQRWYDGWASGGKVAVAHAKIKMLRMLFSYGTALLEDADCSRLSTVLSKMKFAMPRPRTVRMTADQAIAIREKAREMGKPSIALAQAFQFELMLRQKDVIGEYVPLSEPGASEIMRLVDGGKREKWLRGIRWSEIDENMTLRHVTSKRQKAITISLRNAPMVMEELSMLGDVIPQAGPVIVCETTRAPWVTVEFRRWWRKIATEAGIPTAIRNMDSRAGGISEATDGGADLEHVRHAATHSNISTTINYSRGSEDKIANVQKLRVEHRNKPKT